MTHYATELATITSNVVRAQNLNFLSADFQLKRAGNLVRISIQMTTAVAMNLEPDTGSIVHLNGGSALPANGVSTFELALDHGRTWNLKCPDASGGTIDFLCIQEVSA